MELFEGDMILTKAQFKAAMEGGDVDSLADARKASKHYLWPGGVVHYSLEQQLSNLVFMHYCFSFTVHLKFVSFNVLCNMEIHYKILRSLHPYPFVFGLRLLKPSDLGKKPRYLFSLATFYK